jgi:hypothetical protein
MDKELIRRLAMESNIVDAAMCNRAQLVTDYGDATESVERFAQLVAEQCAKLCEETPESDEPRDGFYAEIIRAKFA